MTKAYAYLRVSGKGQIDGDGFSRQKAAIKAYAAAHNILIVDEYREEGQSGATDSDDRPAWVEMIGRIIANGVKTVLIERLDRLARDLMIQEHIVADLQKRDIKLISTAEPDLCTNDPTRKFMRQVLGAVAEYDRQMVVLKLRGARQRARARDGRCEGAKPFGEYPGEAQVLERIKTLRAAGESYATIAARLNREGIPPRRGLKWHPFAVDRIIRRVS
jgi:DNA invertase Pin-like site-specific DNA recombinase